MALRIVSLCTKIILGIHFNNYVNFQLTISDLKTTIEYCIHKEQVDGVE